MGAGGGLRVILYREHRQGAMSHSFKSLIVQIDVGYLDLWIFD